MRQVNLRVADTNGSQLPLTLDEWQDNFMEFSPYATFVVPSAGEYRFESDSAWRVYLTEPMDATPLAVRLIVSFLSGLLAGIIGVGLMIVGILLAAAKGTGTDKRKTEHE
jgi:hypothetical protein